MSTSENNEFSLVLRKNDLLVTESTVVEWHHINGSKTTEALSQLQDKSSCFYIGQQVARTSSNLIDPIFTLINSIWSGVQIVIFA